MEASNSLLSSQFPPPPTAQLKRFPLALMLYEQAAPAVAPMLTTTSLAPQHSTSVFPVHESRDEFKSLSLRVNRTPQAVLDKRHMLSAQEEDAPVDSEKYIQEFQRQLLHWPGLWYLPSDTVQMEKLPSTSTAKQALACKTEKPMGVEPSEVIGLAKKALSASKEAVSLFEDHESFEADLDKSLALSLGATTPGDQVRTVRSTRLLERRSKRRTVPKGTALVHEASRFKRANFRSQNKSSDPDDALRLFSWVPDTKQLLTAKEESELIGHIQELMRLEEVKSRLYDQFGREPTLVEWAKAVGLSARALKFQLHGSNSSREKLIYANFRLVVHIAKQYQGRGLSLHDLLQEGSMGLMWSIKKFKPQVGCRFATYSYWWIRQSVRKAIFHHSRTIRLPDNVYGLLNKVTEAKRQCIQEGHHCPTKEQIAARTGLTVDKLERLLFLTRTPLSIQQPVWTDQNVTFQQVTPDMAIETPKLSAEKQLMRRHVRNLLSILSPKERKIMRLRYGIEGGISRSLSEIGAVFGLSKERVRQLESRALYKLRQRLVSEGLSAYEDLLV